MDTSDVSDSHAMAMVLAVSLELSAAQWKVALHDGQREKPAIHTVSVVDAQKRLQAVCDLIQQHKQVVVARAGACGGQLRDWSRRILD
ncbi:hypothetical protein [Ralstonia chuxiongensis]|uniref:hypothetical protein n=1 Tax=Ralstonia chuxiongensis TaxID=2957504 RepID=UPI0028F55952|nr:hypothetical protein R8510_04695 [Ralstonia chuxiongensis]